MDSKRGLVIFVFVIAFVIFSISFISSTTCDVRLASSCDAVNTVMKLSSQTNAHGASYNGAGNYQYALCCVGMRYYTATDNSSMHTCDSKNNNLVLKLSSSTNAHAQTATSTGYSTNICFGKFQCKALSSCNSEYSIKIYNMLGYAVLIKPDITTDHALDISGLVPGFYIVEISVKGEYKKSVKILKL